MNRVKTKKELTRIINNKYLYDISQNYMAKEETSEKNNKGKRERNCCNHEGTCIHTDKTTEICDTAL